MFSPAPEPTITVTNTVVVTPSPPVVNVQLPSDPFDFWQDIVFGDFGGSLVGSALAVGGAIFVAFYAVRRDREMRREEYFREHVLRYRQAVRKVAGSLRSEHVGQISGGFLAGIEAMHEESALMHYRLNKQQKEFLLWLSRWLLWITEQDHEAIVRSWTPGKREGMAIKLMSYSDHLDSYLANPDRWISTKHPEPQPRIVDKL